MVMCKAAASGSDKFKAAYQLNSVTFDGWTYWWAIYEIEREKIKYVADLMTSSLILWLISLVGIVLYWMRPRFHLECYTIAAPHFVSQLWSVLGRQSSFTQVTPNLTKYVRA